MFYYISCLFFEFSQTSPPHPYGCVCFSTHLPQMYVTIFTNRPKLLSSFFWSNCWDCRMLEIILGSSKVIGSCGRRRWAIYQWRSTMTAAVTGLRRRLRHPATLKLHSSMTGSAVISTFRSNTSRSLLIHYLVLLLFFSLLELIWRTGINLKICRSWGNVEVKFLVSAEVAKRIVEFKST